MQSDKASGADPPAGWQTQATNCGDQNIHIHTHIPVYRILYTYMGKGRNVAAAATVPRRSKYPVIIISVTVS